MLCQRKWHGVRLGFFVCFGVYFPDSCVWLGKARRGADLMCKGEVTAAAVGEEGAGPTHKNISRFREVLVEAPPPNTW